MLESTASAAAREQFETNVLGPLAGNQAFAPILVKNGGGASLNVLSALSWLSFPNGATYAVS